MLRAGSALAFRVASRLDPTSWNQVHSAFGQMLLFTSGLSFAVAQ